MYCMNAYLIVIKKELPLLYTDDLSIFLAVYFSANKLEINSVWWLLLHMVIIIRLLLTSYTFGSWWNCSVFRTEQVQDATSALQSQKRDPSDAGPYTPILCPGA